MILASQNENLGTHSKRRGQPQGRRYGLAYARENLCREQKLAGAEIRNLVIGVPASSKFASRFGLHSSSKPGAGGQQFVALPSRSLLPIQNCAHDLVCQDTYRSPVVHSKVSVRYAQQVARDGIDEVQKFTGFGAAHDH